MRPSSPNAAQAGLKHFCIEQDNAADWGDSPVAARVSYQNLLKILWGPISASRGLLDIARAKSDILLSVWTSTT